MKTYFKILAMATIIMLSACSTPEGTTSRAYSDDIYYSSKDAVADKAKKQAENERYNAEAAKRASETTTSYTPSSNTSSSEKAPSERSTVTDDYYQPQTTTTTTDGNTYVTNNYYDQPFNYDDYYDYAYSTRIRRFHNNVGAYGYYDNYYTNSYWYTGDPYTYGSSVYLGYSWWGPSYVSYSYSPRMYWYASWGWGFDPWYNPCGFNPYRYGYYGYNYYGYSPYMVGYMNGYHQGFYNGYYSSIYNNNYFNSRDNNSYHYGPRKATGSNGREVSQPVMATRYTQAMADTKNVDVDNGGTDRNGKKPIPLDNSTNVGNSATPTAPLVNGKDERPANPKLSTMDNNTGTGGGSNNPNRPTPTKNMDQPVNSGNNTAAPVINGVDNTPRPPKPTMNNTNQNNNSQSGGNVPSNTEQPNYRQPKNKQPVNSQPGYTPPANQPPTNNQPRHTPPSNQRQSSPPNYSAPPQRGNSNSGTPAPTRGPRR